MADQRREVLIQSALIGGGSLDQRLMKALRGHPAVTRRYLALGSRSTRFGPRGRHAVHLPAIKTFGQRFGAVGWARLNQLQPSGYKRLGAGIRGAGEILKTEAGTPNRLLVVLSDGFPDDDGYEGRYAEVDAHACATSLADLSPRMDELFLSSLRELAAPTPQHG